MASLSPRVPVTPTGATVRPITIAPGSRVLDVSNNITTPSSNGGDGSIWKRLRDAGFDEDSIRRRDKAALIAYIAKLEAEVYDLHHNMGLLILERKDYASKYEGTRLSTDLDEVKHLRDQAAQSAALAEARKHEDNLKKSLGIQKECVANLEKALHEMRAECAETKVAAESTMAKARSMVHDAQQKYIEAESKLRAAESYRDEASRSERTAARKLQEVEAREDDLRRRIASFKSDSDVKEKDIMLERQSLAERQRVLNESHNKLLDGQALLNQREADILNKLQVLKRVERELEDKEENIAAQRRALMEQKSSLELDAHSLSEREKNVIEKEVILTKKEQDLLVSQEKVASKEHSEVQKFLAEQEMVLKRRRDEVEAELVERQKHAEEEIETKRRAWELRELDLKQREDLILEKEQDLEVQSRVIGDKGKDLAERIKAVQERESHLNKSEEEFELGKILLQKDREQIDKAKMDLENSLLGFEEDKKRIAETEQKLELMKSETNELLILETKLKEEIDLIRGQKQQLEAEAERLKVEKAKFETEWEAIDEKRVELRREEESIAREKVAILEFLKEQRDSLNLEKEALREQYKRDLESLAHDREAFRVESESERSQWFTKFQQERADFLLEIECRKRELEDSVNKRRGDIESYLREKEKAFEDEKKRELQYIGSLKEDLIKEQERVALALKKLETEKTEIKLDREQRDKAWAELQNLIEELQMQRLKLKEQRELLHADREEIHKQIEQLKKLEDVKVISDRIVVPLTHETCRESIPQVLIRVPPFQQTQKVLSAEDRQYTEGERVPSFEPNEKVMSAEDRYEIEGESPSGGSVSWLRKCASLIFKPDKLKHMDSSLDSDSEDEKMGSVEKEMRRIDDKIRAQEGMQMLVASVGNNGKSGRTASDEPKVIHEVPPVVEDATHLEALKDVNESSVPSSATPLVGRKRRVHDVSAPATDVVVLNDEKIYKKRRQEVVDAHDDCVELEQQTVVDQYVSTSTQSERTKEKTLDVTDEIDAPSKTTPELVETGKCQIKVQQSEVEKSGLVEKEALTCIVLEQTVIQEVTIVDDGEAHKSHEDAAASENKEQDADPSDTGVDKPETAKKRGRARSKAKQIA